MILHSSMEAGLGGGGVLTSQNCDAGPMSRPPHGASSQPWGPEQAELPKTFAFHFVFYTNSFLSFFFWPLHVKLRATVLQQA